MERVAQGEELLEFRDVESHLSDQASLIGVDTVAKPPPAPKPKKKRCSCRKTTDTDNDDNDSSLSEESWGDDDPGPPWCPPADQMDVDNDGPSQM